LILEVGQNFFDFLIVGSAKLLPRKKILFGATARHKQAPAINKTFSSFFKKVLKKF
jgi:hypothetical protein